MFSLSKMFIKKICPNCLAPNLTIPAGSVVELCRKCKKEHEAIHFRLPDGKEFYIVAKRAS